MVYTAKKKTLSRTAASRKALLVSLSNALLKYKRIMTTLAKAKALARCIAPIITHARNWVTTNPNHAYRHAFSILRDKKTVPMLFDQILPKIKDRPGGYTRVIKLGPRKSDSAQMAYIELVDFNTIYSAKKVKTRRKRKKSNVKTNLSNQSIAKTNTEAKNKVVQSQTLASEVVKTYE